MKLSAFERLIREHVDDGIRCWRHLDAVQKTALAAAYFAADYARTDVAEILASDPDVDELLAQAVRACEADADSQPEELASLGVLFIRLLHAAADYAVDQALEEERERRELDRECAEEARGVAMRGKGHFG